VSENSTSVGASPDRLFTPVDELLSAAAAERHQQLRGAGAPAISLTDDGPYSRTNIFTAEYSDTCESPPHPNVLNYYASVHR